MPEIKTRKITRDVKVIDKASVAGERMCSAFVRTKEKTQDWMDERQASPSDYAEQQIQYAAEETTRKVGYEVTRGSAHVRNVHSRSIKTANSPSKNIKQKSNSIAQVTAKGGKGIIKTAEKSIKTKTAKQSSKTVVKASRTTAKVSETAVRVTTETIKKAVYSAKVAVEATATTIKASASAIAAGGWVAVVIIVIVCLLAMFVACLAFLFPNGEVGSGSEMIRYLSK